MARRVGWVWLAVVVVAAAGCTASGGGGGHKSASHAPAPAAVISTSVTKATGVSPGSPVTVKVAHGTLASAALKNAKGTAVTGTFSRDRTSWSTTGTIAYGTKYTLTATARNTDGKSVSSNSSFSTVKPANYTLPYLQRVGGYALSNGATYGVGIVPVVHFDEHVTDRAAAEKALVVTTNPHVDGSWYWADDQNVHWRPENYYTPGTKVTIDAKVYGVRVGKGLYGQANRTASFTIGAKHVAIADDKTHQVKVYFDDKLARTMNTSMGQGGYVQGKNGSISLWTMSGTYTVLDHGNPVSMSSDSYGLPANSPYGYAPEDVYWATKISTDGIYLHELETTVWAQGHQDVSHGCLNLNHANANWYYKTSVIGDVVQVVHTTGPKIELWQNGDWSVPWSTWQSHSALR
ncbi:MAG TPA: Ig-like domain-containing protein [Actinocatenispora sp.]